METKVRIFLHPDDEVDGLKDAYRRALNKSEELLIVSAYLTNWDSSVPLNPNCNRFRMVVGKDFGITRKAACEEVLKWAPPNVRVHFRVADQIEGFHPKAVFWREADGRTYAIMGSSNLSVAAFEKNFEANIALPISVEDFDRASRWVDQIASRSVPVSPDWLKVYKEAEPRGHKRGDSRNAAEVLPIQLPNPKNTKKLVKERRKKLANYLKKRDGLHNLFRECKSGAISSAQFYANLQDYWSYDQGNRLQGNGWERSGKGADFQQLAESYLKIVEATAETRDDTVVAEIDHLSRRQNPARKAFLSEMLCLEFPDLYPVLNKPVQNYINHNNFKGTAGLSEGAKYLDLALRLRLSLSQDSKHAAKNIAELDTVIRSAFGDN